MKKLLFFVLIFNMAIGSAFAAGSLLDSFLAMKTFEADFVQENYYPGVDSFSYKGKVYMQRGNKALWDYTEPDEFYLLEAGSIMHYSAELKQAVKMKVDMSRIDDPAAVLLGILLNVRSIPDTFSVKEAGNIVTLTPTKDIGLKAIIIEITNGKLTSLSSADNSGNKISIKFLNVKQDAAIDTKVFAKTFPKGTSVIEQ
jgi:outer membrane lipoprotein carrier protein